MRACAVTCCKVPGSGMRPAWGWRTSPCRSSPARPRELRPAPAPTGNWKRAHRRRQESSSSRCATDRAPGTRARAIWVIRCGNSRFRLSVRARASTASCISTTRPRRPLPRCNARRDDGSPSPQHLWLTAFARAARAPAPPRVSEEEALRASGPDAVYYATRLRGASNEKAVRELDFRPRPLEWI